MTPARLELSASWTLAWVIVLAHASAALSVWIALPGPAGGFLALALAALGLAAAWSRGLHGSAASVHALELAGREMCVQLKNGTRFAVELGGRRSINRWMVTLPVRRPWRRTILVTRDMLGADEFRRLRLWSLWGELPGGVVGKQLPA